MSGDIRPFECAMCGQCCANQDLIQLTSYELFRLAERLNVPPAELFSRYCEIGATSLNPMIHMYLRTVEQRCPFLDGKLCSVHDARPYACRAYPKRQAYLTAGEMKTFVRSRYPMLEPTCDLFGLDDTVEMIGDADVLTDQTIAYMTDELYFNTIRPEQVDLTVPYDVTDSFLRDGLVREIVLTYLARPYLGSLADTPLTGIIAMTLQARVWGAGVSFVRQPSDIAVQEDARIGQYLLAKTDATSVEALRALVESGRMDLGRAFFTTAADGKARISAVYASASDKVAIGFQLEADASAVERLTNGGARPAYVFFLPEDGSSTKAVGLAVGG
ncbi:YkgJ family cysteine cluster protein [Methanocella sp. MCL-LM]|uniref:YkgJ family cysteine cluster protein n=1 Tax=Methanocella sp. MCL-LM TaxID=3412035 RepID=UPI003C7436E2